MKRTRTAKIAKKAPRKPAAAKLVDGGVAKELRAAVDADGVKLVQLLYKWLDELNAEHFGGELPPVVLLLAATSSPRALGDHIRQDEHGIRYRVRIRPSTAKRGPLFLRDVLLHELVHVAQEHHDEAACADQIGEPGYRGHGPRFAARCNAIGAKLGLREVAARDRKKKLFSNDEPMPDCAQWPINVRPAGYYGEEPEKPSKPSKPKAEPESDDGASGGGGRGGSRVADLEAAIRDALAQLEDVDDFAARNAAGILAAAIGDS